MSKRKKQDWGQVPWTEFRPGRQPDPRDYPSPEMAPVVVAVNSRYQVSVFMSGPVEPFGHIAHLSIKTHDRAARHDWRDLQRIKNELCGPECDAVEVYPAESKLVDTSNQFHLFVFQDYKLPFGFQTRLVGDGTWKESKQRPFPPGERPADCLNSEEYAAKLAAVMDARPALTLAEDTTLADKAPALTVAAQVLEMLAEEKQEQAPAVVDGLRDEVRRADR